MAEALKLIRSSIFLLFLLCQFCRIISYFCQEILSGNFLFLMFSVFLMFLIKAIHWKVQEWRKLYVIYFHYCNLGSVIWYTGHLHRFHLCIYYTNFYNFCHHCYHYVKRNSNQMVKSCSKAVHRLSASLALCAWQVTSPTTPDRALDHYY